MPERGGLARVKVDPATGCWLWTGALNNQGYGQVSVNGRTQLAHRVSYTLHVGPIPRGLVIDHLCFVRACINPEHLEAVTGQENARRAAARRTTCKAGHPLTKRGRGAGTARCCRRCERSGRIRASTAADIPLLAEEATAWPT